jgi:hypothetical protein
MGRSYEDGGTNSERGQFTQLKKNGHTLISGGLSPMLSTIN